MIIGFGTQETQTAKEIIEECIEAVKLNLKDPLEAVRTITEKYHALGEEYKAMSKSEAPERYTYFYAYVHSIWEGFVLMEFKMHHINRRHAFSSDGWALMVTHWTASFRDEDDEVHIYQEV